MKAEVGLVPEDSPTPTEARSFPAGGVIARCGWDARKPLVIMHLGGATKTMEGWIFGFRREGGMFLARQKGGEVWCNIKKLEVQNLFASKVYSKAF